MQLVHFDAPPPPEEDQYYEMSEGEQQSKEALQNVNFYWNKTENPSSPYPRALY
jgi:hypothetical protein